MRILLVEDEPEIARFVQRGLAEARYAVDHVDDGRLGLYQAAVNRYDLILCDYMLPQRDGITLARELRDRSVGTPLLMMTVVDDLDTKVRALDAGADDYICKPFAIRELLARTRALLRRQPSYAREVLRLDDVMLNLTSQVVQRSGVPVRLTRKEFMLLEYLLRNVDRAIPRAEILEHVWDSAADPLTNSIEVHIRYLRRKLELAFPGRPRFIQTVHGVGYRASLARHR
ncbi:MAG: response regulator transcription factor [Candidatus Andersenbacteria bacterium]